MDLEADGRGLLYGYLTRYLSAKTQKKSEKYQPGESAKFWSEIFPIIILDVYS
jgi:hypothetical protein